MGGMCFSREYLTGGFRGFRLADGRFGGGGLA